MQGIDLFSGAGGMSVGAIRSGVDVRYAVEKDKFAAQTFCFNHPKTHMFCRDIRGIEANQFELNERTEPIIMFGGPPCQGFSTSNQKNRGKTNENNWLYQEYMRLVKAIYPDWVVFENVKGLVETEGGFFLDAVLQQFKDIGYVSSQFILNSADFGVPQKRNRLFIVASLHGVEVIAPPPLGIASVTVGEAISDLPKLENGDTPNEKVYSAPAGSTYAVSMRQGLDSCWNNLVTNNAPNIVERYYHIPQGGNWEDIPVALMQNYKDSSRCHTGIYRRLKIDEPSVVIGNFRKNMLIHPLKHRGLSVREAARLQSIPDTFRFFGSIGFQQQQVGNLVPPLLAEAVFKQIIRANGAAN